MNEVLIFKILETEWRLPVRFPIRPLMSLIVIFWHFLRSCIRITLWVQAFFSFLSLISYWSPTFQIDSATYSFINQRYALHFNE